MSCKLEPAIWSRDTGQRIPCFDRCQLIITWMSNVNEAHGKPRLHVCIWYGRHVARLRRRRRAHAPTSNTASRENHEKINSWVSFSFLYEYEAPLGGPSGRQSSATIISCVSCDRVLDLKLRCCYGQLSSFPMATISLPTILSAFLPLIPKDDKLPLETEPVAQDNNKS